MVDRKVIEEIKKVNMVAFLGSQGYSFKKEGANFYRCIEHSSLILKEKDNIFTYYWNAQNEHGDIIDFVQSNICNGGFIEAVSYLKAYLGLNNTIYIAKHKEDTGHQGSCVNDKFEIEFADNKKRVIAYLCKTRGLEYSIVLSFIKKGLISQDKRNNVVFLFKDEKGQTVGADTIGTNSKIRYKGIKKNSNEEYGFSINIGTEAKSIYVFESCIDLLSYYEMYKSELSNAVLLSLSGAGKINKIEKYVKDGTEAIYMCTDNDEAGSKCIEDINNLFVDSNIKILDNRDALMAYNVKDYNELLQIKKCSLKEA